MEKISRTIMENCLTLICHHPMGRQVLQIVDVELFEAEYRTIAEKAKKYWKDYKEPPKDHTADMLSDILEDPNNKRVNAYTRILVSMIELAETINVDYVMSQLNRFVKAQRFKDGILKSFEKINSKEEMAVEEVEQIWNDLLKLRGKTTFDPGMQMMEVPRLTNWMENQVGEFSSGIRFFDRHNITPFRNKVMLFLAPAGFGKTWFLVNVAKHALLMKKKVVFISLEMDEEEIIQRHWQAMFAASKSATEIKTMQLHYNSDLNKLQDMEMVDDTPTFVFNHETIREELESRVIKNESSFMRNLYVKRFPPRSINVDGISAWLSNMKEIEGFLPDMIILDYIGRIKTKLELHRLGLSTQFEEFRGMCIEYNAAGVTAQQVNRKGMESEQVKSGDVAEDASFIHTADNILTFSATESERKFGLARVKNTKARSDRGEFTALITQNYGIGQFCLDSIRLTPNYNSMFKEISGEKDEGYVKGDDDEEDGE